MALRYPIKKIAAGAALAVLTGYLLLSGAAIPTERAFIMNGLVFAAVLIDRLRISMRICALAAAFVLAIEPESFVGVSFQMSFGAVVALIAVYEAYGQRLARLLHRPSLPGRVLGYAGAVVVTTVVVTIGTDPFSIYHFHHIALYSPLANVVAVPLSAIWTLPWGVVACLLMPFGLERVALTPMGWGIDATIEVARLVSALPGNVWPMPRLPMAGLALVSLGGLWLCLWRGRWRRWGALAIAAGLAGMALTRPPDIVIAHFARFVAVRGPDQNYFVSSGWGERMDGSLLAEETGLKLAAWPQAGPQRRARLRRRSLPLFGARPHGRDRHRRCRAAGRVQRRRCDRQPSLGRAALPLGTAGDRLALLLAAGRRGAVARPRRCGGRERQRKSRRPALGPASATAAAMAGVTPLLMALIGKRFGGELSAHFADIIDQYQAKNSRSSATEPVTASVSPAWRNPSAKRPSRPVAGEAASRAAMRATSISVRSADFGITRSNAAWRSSTSIRLSGPKTTKSPAAGIVGQ